MKRWALLLLWSLQVPTIAGAAPRASMEIVIDQSESMDATAKGRTWYRRALEAARKAMEERTPNPAGELTWRVVGGGRAGDESACEATRVIAPAGVSAGMLLQSAAKEKAGGPRPLVAALEAAQADLPRGRQRATILITSGSDTCGRNICMAASDLRKGEGLGLVRVILVGTDAQAEGRLVCLGPVARVTDPEKLQGRVTEALEVLDRPAEITVTANEAGKDVSGQVELFAHEEDHPFAVGRTGEPMQVMAGTFHVHVTRTGGDREGLRDGWRRNVEIVPDARLTVRVPMGQEQAEITATVLFNGVPAPQGTRVAIFHLGETDTSFAEGFPDEPIHVPAGKYDVRALIPGGPIDSIQVWKPEVKVLPGQKVAVTLSAIQKRGELQAEVTSGGQKVSDATLMLLPPGSRTESEAIFAPGDRVPVPVGKYTVLAQLSTPGGVLQSFKDGVVIAADQLTPVRLELGPMGQLRVEVTDRKPQDGLVITLVKAGQDVDLGLIEAFVDYDLPAGTYDLRVQDPSKGIPAIYWHRDAKVVAGKKVVATVKPKIGRE